MPITTKINHVTILVSSKHKAKKFYCDILGLERHKVGESLWLKIGEQYVHITENSGEPIPGSFYHFAIEVERAMDYANYLINKGVKVFVLDKDRNEVEIWTGLEYKQYFVRDADGNLIEFIEKGSDFFNPKYKFIHQEDEQIEK